MPMFMNSGADLASELRPRTPALSIDQENSDELTSLWNSYSVIIIIL